MQQTALGFETLTGTAVRRLLPELSRLRLTVFREWPYLYDGEERHERDYISAYAASPGAAAVVCRDGAEVVGAATCTPMSQGHAEVRQAFAAAGRDPAAHCYFGESVLLGRYRGRGAGVRFFADREAHARALGLRFAAFCAVVRPADDLRRPRDHVPLDNFWRHRGYAPLPDLRVVFAWRELGADAESAHTLLFWIKDLQA